jgi:outer membrane protein OmpA-like peptidoglycan-associated protein
MIGQTKSGKIVEKTTAHVVLWTPAKMDEGTRYSIIYEFNSSEAISMYEKYLTEIVTPKFYRTTVMIKGHTDVIGGGLQSKLSLARANDVKTIIQNSLSKAGRNDVKFDVSGYGENENNAPFDNKTQRNAFTTILL